jgi:hypothetical protein
MKIYIIILMCLFGLSASAQVMQESNANRADRRVVVKNGFRLPQVCNPSTAPSLLNYTGDSAKGGLVYDTCNNNIKWWTGSAWDSVSTGGACGVDTIYRKAGQDSIFFTICGGVERAIKDSTGAGGGGVPIDSVAIRRIGVHYVGWNSGFGGAGNNGGSAASMNFFAGNNVGSAITTGANNVAIGNTAMQDITTGGRNVALGSSAGQNIQNGNSNFAMGSGSLDALVSGSNNVAIGESALNKTTGSTNVGIGVGALQNFTGSGATAVGGSSLSAVTSGVRNVALGSSTGGSITTGSNNTIVGTEAMLSSGTAVSGSVIIGYDAGRGITGNDNVVIGARRGSILTGLGTTKLQAVNIGSGAGYFSNENYATLIGADAGNGTSTFTHSGQYNIGIGYQALRNATATRTGSSNIAIGDRIDLPSVTSSNQVVIGSNAVNWLTKFTGGGWLINNSGSAVTTQTASTYLELNGTAGAFLPPRLTTGQRDLLTAAAGMIIYNTTTNKHQGYDGTTWNDFY